VQIKSPAFWQQTCVVLIDNLILMDNLCCAD
jgi:hypothetical protein